MAVDGGRMASAGACICDYEGSSYRRDFWEGTGRAYEDAAERLAIRRLLPPHGDRLLEVGAGFGRLASEYAGYETVVLLDYARSMLLDARSRLGDGYIYVCADLYRLPIASSAFDAITMVRVLHHVDRPAAALAEVQRSLRPGGSLILEFANKRHAKALLRYAAGRQSASPLAREPLEFRPAHYDFHPAYVVDALRQAGLVVRQQRAVSHFRLAALKRHVPAAMLARADDAIAGPLGRLALSPSVFVRSARLTGGPPATGLWRCPQCGAEPLEPTHNGIPCPGCGRFWPKVEGVYLMREVGEEAHGG